MCKCGCSVVVTAYALFFLLFILSFWTFANKIHTLFRYACVGNIVHAIMRTCNVDATTRGLRALFDAQSYIGKERKGNYEDI